MRGREGTDITLRSIQRNKVKPFRKKKKRKLTLPKAPKYKKASAETAVTRWAWSSLFHAHPTYKNPESLGFSGFPLFHVVKQRVGL